MMLKEGGNIFKGSQGELLTGRINQADVAPTVKWLEGITGLPLQDGMLGTTGKAPTSGDLDLSVDENKISKDELVAKLSQWAQSKNKIPNSGCARVASPCILKLPLQVMRKKVLCRQILCLVNLSGKSSVYRVA